MSISVAHTLFRHGDKKSYIFTDGTNIHCYDDFMIIDYDIMLLSLMVNYE